MELQQKLDTLQNYDVRLGHQVKELRQELQWLILTKRREMCRASLMYRCLHNQAPSYFKIRTNADMGNNHTRGRNMIYLPHVRTKYGR